jgi:predicted nucleic acid-binding protein
MELLVDSSVCIDHLRSGDDALAAALEENRVFAHPGVIGELALGRLANRHEVLDALSALPSCVVASHAEIRVFIERNQLAGSGMGYVEADLLASVALTPAARLWTRDRKLTECARRLGLAWQSH